VVEAEWISRTKNLQAFICCQDEYSLLAREPETELIPAMKSYGLGLLRYFPLASGLLSGKYKRDQLPEGARLTKTKRLSDRYMNETNWGKVEKLQNFCSERGHSLLELAFSWLAASPVVSSIIAGATKPGQIEQNIKAVGWKLTPEDMTAVDGIMQ
jgi:aryl-alcohol dehydrogenase-like predicted oxidoreductase